MRVHVSILFTFMLIVFRQISAANLINVNLNVKNQTIDSKLTFKET